MIQSSDFFIDMAEEALVKAKTSKERKQLNKTIKNLTKKREQAINDLEFCNVVWSLDRAEGEAKCQAMHPPEGGTGGSGTGPAVGCEPGYLLCGEYCCNVQVAFCQGCGGNPTCCRTGGNCCPRLE